MDSLTFPKFDVQTGHEVKLGACFFPTPSYRAAPRRELRGAAVTGNASSSSEPAQNNFASSRDTASVTGRPRSTLFTYADDSVLVVPPEHTVTDYESAAELAEAHEPNSFPIVGEIPPLHFLVALISTQGRRILGLD